MTSFTRSASERAFTVLPVVACLQAIKTKVLGIDNLATFINPEIEKIISWVQTVIATTFEAINFACVVGDCPARMRLGVLVCVCSFVIDVP